MVTRIEWSSLIIEKCRWSLDDEQPEEDGSPLLFCQGVKQESGGKQCETEDSTR